MTEQIAERTKTNPWDTNKWPPKDNHECHITKLKCEVPATTERTGIQKHIKVWFVVDKGRSKGAELDTIVSVQEAHQAFKLWCDVAALEVGQEYTFDLDERPFSMVVYRTNRYQLSDIQTDFAHRAALVNERMVAAGLGAQYNTGDNREKIRAFDTTAQALVWADEYIKEHGKPMADIPDSVLDDLKEQGSALNEWFPRDDEPPTSTTPEWVTKELGIFWRDVNECGKQYPQWAALTSEERTEFVRGVIGSKLHETTLTRPQATKRAIDGINGTYSGQPVPAKHWADDAPNVAVICKGLKPFAAKKEIADEHIISEACHALKIKRPQDFKGTGQQFKDAVIKAWFPPENEKPSETPQISTEATPPAISEPETPPAQTSVPQSEAKQANKLEVEELIPSPLLSELKTLTGISVTKIQSYINRRHDPRYYKKIQARSKDDNHWTDLDPVAVRKRLDRVFGFQGLGWRIVPAVGGGQVTCTPFMQQTRNGERQMYAVTMNAYVLEYALTDSTGKIIYVQTSAFSDGDMNDDMGYAHRGAMTSLMKQALSALGGFDHFKDKAAS